MFLKYCCKHITPFFKLSFTIIRAPGSTAPQGNQVDEDSALLYEIMMTLISGFFSRFESDFPSPKYLSLLSSKCFSENPKALEAVEAIKKAIVCLNQVQNVDKTGFIHNCFDDVYSLFIG